MGHSEVSMKEGDTVELLKIGCAGWWYVKILSKYYLFIISIGNIPPQNAHLIRFLIYQGNKAEGWAPAAFLDPINRRTQRSNSKQIEQN